MFPIPVKVKVGACGFVTSRVPSCQFPTPCDTASTSDEPEPVKSPTQSSPAIDPAVTPLSAAKTAIDSHLSPTVAPVDDEPVGAARVR
ncbi:hypothetical protein GCM10022236_03350 [Microlunatus ginsengisoli]|uniref:Uncharacterized protein n=1 Tax=Microlunatus ginsengisoli TaxID=363863 RepID=A0ABP6ZFP1_9ACTN